MLLRLCRNGQLLWCAGLLCVLLSWPCQAQQADTSYGADKTLAHELFFQGKIKQAAVKLGAAIAKAPSPGEKLGIARDLLEVCAAGYYWDCVGQTIAQMAATIKTDDKFRVLIPEVLLYEIKMMRWNQSDAYINKSRSDGAPFNFINVAMAPALTAELQLELAAYELKKNDRRGAEQRMASAILGLLLTDPNQIHNIGKVIVQMIERLVSAQDVVGATSLALASQPFFELIPVNSVLRLNHRLVMAQVLAFMNDHGATAKAFMEAIPEIERVEIEDSVKKRQVATANNLALAALVLSNKTRRGQGAAR